MNEEQLERRKSGIGGSDASAVLGLNPYKTPYQLWLEKTGQVEPDDVSGKEAVKWGNRLESVVCDAFAEETGKTLHRVNQTLQHPDLPFMLGHLDRRVVGERALFEAKTTGRASDDWGESGTDMVPEMHLIQSSHYMMVTGYQLAYLAVLIAGNDFRWYRIPRNERLIELLTIAESAFWRNVLERKEPEITSAADAQRRYRVSTDVTVDATPEMLLSIVTMKGLKEQLETLEAQYEEQKGLVMAGMGDADTLVHLGKKIATWKSSRAFDEDVFSAQHPPSAYPDFYKTVVDKDRLKKANKGLYDSFSAPASRRFLISKG